MLDKTKTMILAFVLIFAICIQAQNADIFTMLDQMIKDVEMASKQLKDTKNSEELRGIISDITQEQSSDKYDLIVELSESIDKLSEKDADIYYLEGLADINSTLKSVINAEYSYDVDEMSKSSRVRSISRNTRGTRGNIFEKVFGEKLIEKAQEKIKEEILNLDVDFDVSLLDLDIAEGIGLGAKYKWGLEPSYNDGFFTRIDAYMLKGKLNPGDIIKDALGESLPVYLNISSEHKIIFARQFKDQKKAAIAIPYNPLRLPVNAENAIKMDTGDFVSIPAKLHMVVGASAGYSAGVNVSGNMYYMLSGEFRINVLKVDSDHVRVKLTGMRRKGHGGGVSVGYGFNVFGIKIIDKQVGKFLDTNIIKINHSKIDGENFSVDYVFDLRDSSANKAYDRLMKSNLKFNVAKTTNPFNSEDNMSETFFNDLSSAEMLFQEDIQRNAPERRVNRLFKASNFFEQKQSSFKLGINLIKFGWGKSYIENRLAIYDNNNRINNYFVPVLNVNNDSKFLFGYYKEKENKNYYSLLETDQNWNVNDMHTLSFTWSKTDKVCFSREFKNLKEELVKSLGPIAENSEIINMPVPDKKVRKLRWNMKMVIDRDSAIALLGGRGLEDDLWKAMYQTMLVYGDDLCWHAQNNDSNEDDYWRTWTKKFSPYKKSVFTLFKQKRWDYRKWKSIERYVKEMDKIFKTYSYTDKMKEYFDLTKKSFYREFGIRYLIELAKIKGVNFGYNLKFRTTARGMDSFEVKSGNVNINENMYHSINRMISNITDSSYDLFDATEMNY